VAAIQAVCSGDLQVALALHEGGNAKEDYVRQCYHIDPLSMQCGCTVHWALPIGWATHKSNPSPHEHYSKEAKAFLSEKFSATERIEACEAAKQMRQYFHGGVGHGYEHRKTRQQIKSWFSRMAQKNKAASTEAAKEKAEEKEKEKAAANKKREEKAAEKEKEQAAAKKKREEKAAEKQKEQAAAKKKREEKAAKKQKDEADAKEKREQDKAAAKKKREQQAAEKEAGQAAAKEKREKEKAAEKEKREKEKAAAKEKEKAAAKEKREQQAADKEKEKAAAKEKQEQAEQHKAAAVVEEQLAAMAADRQRAREALMRAPGNGKRTRCGSDSNDSNGGEQRKSRTTSARGRVSSKQTIPAKYR
jgi:colicin import membrane protein